MENITSELISTIHERAYAYSQARYDRTPDKIIITESGIIQLMFEDVWYGEREVDYEYINPEDLTKDLDEVAAVRRAEEERKRKEKEEYLRKQREQQENMERAFRRQEYEKLRREFEQ